MKPRIHIIGGRGSGKSYAAFALSARCGVNAYDLDDLFWDRSATGYGVRSQTAVRAKQLASIVARDGWIIGGVYYGWLTPSFAAADIIIALTPSILVRHWRVMKRFVLRNFGRMPSKKEESLATRRRCGCSRTSISRAGAMCPRARLAGCRVRRIPLARIVRERA